MSDVIAATVGSLTGALLEVTDSGRRERARDRRERRRGSAAQLLEDLRPLHRRMRRIDFSRNAAKWSRVIDRALRSVEAHQAVLPDDWRHLYRSLRDAVGTATGLGWREVLGGKPKTVASFDALWLERGAGYIGYVIHAIELWQAAFKESKAVRVGLMDFDSWLREVERRSAIGV